jgi:transposase InsO family protein
MSSARFPDSLPATWLAQRLAVDPGLIDAMRRDGELIAVREPGSTDWFYPSWQLRGGEPLTSVRRITRAAREAGIDESRLYTILSAKRGLNGAGHVYELLRDGRDDEVVELVRAG